MIEFWVMTCNKKKCGLEFLSCHSTARKIEKHFYVFFDHADRWHSFAKVSTPTRERTHRHSHMTFILQSWNLCHSWKKKCFCRFLSGPKFCIHRYMVYNFHCSISEHYRQWHTQSDTLTVAHSEWNTHSGTLTSETNKCTIWSFPSK